MRSLVTGVTGQDGWYLSELLTGRGEQVFGLVTAGDEANLPPGVEPLSGDMRDAQSLRAAVKSCSPDAVYNLASMSSVAASWRDPELVADVNGVGVVRLLALIRELEVAGGRRMRLIQASSAEIFGAAAPPQNEQTPVAPVTPYGAAKAFAHHAVGVYRAAGVWASNVILFNHESPRRPLDFVTRKITRAAARIGAGSDEVLTLGNLEVRRDWGFAGDYAAAMVAVADHDAPADFVIATGVSHTIADFAEAAFRCVGISDWRSKVVIDPALQRAGDVPDQRGDATLARVELGWRPSMTFDQLVATMVDAEIQADE